MLVFGRAPPGVSCHPRLAAYAVIQGEDARVAAVTATVHGRLRYWLPGGGCELGETPGETIVREVREELGRRVHLLGQIGAALQIFYAGDEDRWYEMTAWFMRAQFDGDPIEEGENELHWIDPRRDASSFFHDCHIWAARQRKVTTQPGG